MKEIVVLSGKGGTGKTTVVAALAHLAAAEGRLAMADADVDAANLGLVLGPTPLAEQDFHGGHLAKIDLALCTSCGACEEACRFGALAPDGEAYQVDPVACEGCAACMYRCPAQAISMEEQLAGKWYAADTRFGPLIHAHLFAGQENSGKLVTLVKKQARELGQSREYDYLLVDGPPGIGCPVIAACAGADLALLVTEPTVAGAHDLERALATAEHFGVKSLVCINKCDLNPARAREIEGFCREAGIPVVGRIPFDVAVTEAMVQAKAVTECVDGAVGREIRQLWANVKEALGADDQARAGSG
ncbi:MAG: ATP-binding protein [Dehalococcoidales bacterium]|nr:ATP-binding protein [Dehalococcoidales bacterium]